MRKAFLLFVLALGLAFAGCAHYYKVRDPASGSVYYTDDISRRGSGTICFKDQVTHQTITLNASEILPITKDEFRANIHGR